MMDSLEFSTWSTDSQGVDLEIEDSQGADLEIESDTSSTTTGSYACDTDDTDSQSSCEELQELYLFVSLLTRHRKTRNIGCIVT